MLESLPVNEQCSDAEAELLRLLYESKLKKYQEPIENKLLFGAVNDLVLDRLSTNLDIQISEAERLYYNCDYQQCYSLTEKYARFDIVFFIKMQLKRHYSYHFNILSILQDTKKGSIPQRLSTSPHSLFSRT